MLIQNSVEQILLSLFGILHYLTMACFGRYT